MNKYLGVALIGLVVGVLAGLVLSGGVNLGGAAGTYHTQLEQFAGGLDIGDSGTAVNKYKCYTNTSYNPAAIASSSAPASVAFLTPSATVGDVVIATLGTVTSTNLWYVDAKVTAGSGTTGATTTLYVYPGTLAGVDLSTTTAKVCIIN